jgi:hypothetical protein
MNRRNLFQACAAGLAWLVGGKLPATAAEEKPARRFRSKEVLVINTGLYPIAAGSLLYWSGYGMGVRLADLSNGEVAGFALENAGRGECLKLAVSGYVTAKTKYPDPSGDGSYITVDLDDLI